VIWRCPRTWKAERDVHRAPERSNLDLGHADVVIGRDHGVELPSHRADEDGVGGIRAFYPRLARGGSQQLRVFVAKSPSIPSVRIDRAQRDARRADAEPLLESLTRYARDIDDSVGVEMLYDLPQRDVRRRKNNPKLVGGQHHRDARAGKTREHLGVTGEIVAPRVQREFVDGRRHNYKDSSGLHNIDSSFNSESTQLACDRSL